MRTQSSVHWKHRPIAGVRRKRLHHPFCHSLQGLGVGSFVAHKEHVGIGEQIEFTSSQPPQTQHWRNRRERG